MNIAHFEYRRNTVLIAFLIKYNRHIFDLIFGKYVYYIAEILRLDGNNFNYDATVRFTSTIISKMLLFIYIYICKLIALPKQLL